MKPLAFAITLCVFAGLIGCIKQSSSPPPPPKQKGEVLKKEVAIELKEVKLAQLLDEIKGHKGKVVVIDFWATWCAPCMKEFPHLVKMHHAYPADVVCMSVSFDDRDEAKQKDAALKFLRDKKATFPNYLIGEDQEVFQAHWNFTPIPAVAVYDSTGKLARAFNNNDPAKAAFTYEQVEDLVKSLIKKPG